MNTRLGLRVQGMSSGLIYVFTGEGKGKTSAAIGVAVRSLLLGKKVAWIAFYKQASWGLAEAKLVGKFPNLEMVFGGKGFHMSSKIKRVGDKGNVVVDTASEEEHRAAAAANLQLAIINLQKKPFLLVMDEVLNAITDGLVEESEVMKVLAGRGETHIVLTGRGGEPTRMILEGADLVTECKKVKHPYDSGKLAVAGLDY